MTSVWLVTTGNYSNYTVLMGFTTKELADQYVKRWLEVREESTCDTFDTPQVEEFPLFSEPVEPGNLYWQVTVVVRDGQIESESVSAQELPSHYTPNYGVLTNPSRPWFPEGYHRVIATDRTRQHALSNARTHASVWLKDRQWTPFGTASVGAMSETEREKNEPPLPPALERLKAGDFFLDWSSYGTGDMYVWDGERWRKVATRAELEPW
jgi:hypothetical protein